MILPVFRFISKKCGVTYSSEVLNFFSAIRSEVLHKMLNTRQLQLDNNIYPLRTSAPGSAPNQLKYAGSVTALVPTSASVETIPYLSAKQAVYARK